MFGLSFRKKPVERICKNCKIFDAKLSQCNVVILHEGQKIKLPVDPQDSCFFEQEYFDPKTNTKGDLNAIQEMRMWAEDEYGNKTTEGKVKIEAPNELIQQDII